MKKKKTEKKCFHNRDLNPNFPIYAPAHCHSATEALNAEATYGPLNASFEKVNNCSIFDSKTTIRWNNLFRDVIRYIPSY